MKIYCGKNRRGYWKASTDYDKIEHLSDVFECDVETIHNNKVYMIKCYYGFDYLYPGIVDVITYYPKAFHSVTAAKKSNDWKSREKLAKENPEKYIVSPFSIASNVLDEPFEYGDVMEGNFNMEIFGVKVI